MVPHGCQHLCSTITADKSSGSYMALAHRKAPDRDSRTAPTLQSFLLGVLLHRSSQTLGARQSTTFYGRRPCPSLQRSPHDFVSPHDPGRYYMASPKLGRQAKALCCQQHILLVMLDHSTRDVLMHIMAPRSHARQTEPIPQRPQQGSGSNAILHHADSDAAGHWIHQCAR